MTRSPLCAPVLLLLVAVLPASPRPARAAWPHDPAVGVPVCTADASQRRPVVVPDGSGGAIIAWMDGRGTDWDIYAQRVSASGAPLWSAGGVALCVAAQDQGYPVIVPDGAGGAIVAWEDARTGTKDIYAQRVSSDGVLLWTADGVPLCGAAEEQAALIATTDGSGGAIVAWLDWRSSNYDLYAQRVSPAGSVRWASNGVPVCTLPSDQQEPRITTDGAGGAIVAWWDARNASGDIFAQRITWDGSPVWYADGVVVCTAPGYQGGPAITADSLGGAVVAWLDSRTGGYDIYAQRLGVNGAPQWESDGVAVCTATSSQWFPVTAADGSGGAFIAWQDYRNGDWDVYAQRVSGGGIAQWTANGTALCTTAGDQTTAWIAADGSGDIHACWQDVRNGSNDVYAQRVSAGGTIRWTSDGVAVGTARGDQLEPVLTSDGAGGAIVAWWDGRVGDWDIYAQRVDRYGYLGAEPAIVALRDVPNDQGRRMTLAWDASPLDTGPPDAVADQYVIWRQLPLALALGRLASGARVVAGEAGPEPVDALTTTRALDGGTYYWEFAGTVNAYGLPGYSTLVYTEFDSLPGSAPPTWFMVQARSSASGHFWNSDPVSGCSVDNLAPATPGSFVARPEAGTVRLSWGANTETDFVGYRLYRGTAPDFVPGPASLVTSLTATSYVDEAEAPLCYKLCSVDLHGNPSGYASAWLPGSTTDVPGQALPHAMFLAPPAPNPARDGTALRFGLPHDAGVELALYDQQGRRVRALFSGLQPAGERSLTWDGRDEAGRPLPAGLYFARLTVEGRTLVARLAVLR